MNRKPLYCLLDKSVTDVTGTGFWLAVAHGDLSAPEVMPAGSSYAVKIHQKLIPQQTMVVRGRTHQEQMELDAVCDAIIDEILAEDASTARSFKTKSRP